MPPNCYFEIDDFESDWEFSRPFNFIHGRALVGSVRDFPELYGRIVNNLAPGGWAEMVEVNADAFSDDNTLERAPNIREWSRLLKEASLRFGKD